MNKIDILLKKAVLTVLIIFSVFGTLLILQKIYFLSFLNNLIIYLLPVIISFLFVWLCYPIVVFLEKKKIKKKYGIILIYLIFLSTFIAFLNYMIPLLINQVQNLVKYLPGIKDLIFEIYLKCVKFYESLGFKYTGAIDQDELIKIVIKFFQNYFFASITSVSSSIIGFLSSTFNVLSSLFVGVILSFYIFIDYNRITKTMEKLYPKKIRKELIDLFANINLFLKGYLKGTGAVSLFIFIIMTIGLTIIGMPSPIFFAFICGITNVIPYLGPIIGGAPVVMVAFSIDTKLGFLALLVVIISQFVESNFLQPIVMGKLTNLHPVIIVVSIILFGNFFGIFGVIFATPLAGITREIIVLLNNKYKIF